VYNTSVGGYGGSKTQVTGHCFTDTVTTLTPFLMLTLGLSATIRQCFRPKHYTKTILRFKISISKGLSCSSIDKTMTRDLRFRPARVGIMNEMPISKIEVNQRFCSILHDVCFEHRTRDK